LSLTSIYNDTKTISIITFNVTTLSITVIYHYSECRYAERHVLFIVMLNAVVLNIVLPFQPGLMFGSEAGAYPSALLEGKLLALPKNIVPGLKGLPGTNALA
jgi:hypothetical protein